MVVGNQDCPDSFTAAFLRAFPGHLDITMSPSLPFWKGALQPSGHIMATCFQPLHKAYRIAVDNVAWRRRRK